MDFPSDRGQGIARRCIACGREEGQAHSWIPWAIEDVRRDGTRGVLGGAIACSAVCMLDLILLFTPDSDGARAISLS